MKIKYLSTACVVGEQITKEIKEKNIKIKKTKTYYNRSFAHEPHRQYRLHNWRMEPSTIANYKKTKQIILQDRTIKKNMTFHLRIMQSEMIDI